MRKIRIIEKFEMASIYLIAICLLVAVFCIVEKEERLEYLFYILSLIFGCLCFGFNIWKSYLYDNLSEDKREKLAKEKENALYDEALKYITEEKSGHITRFQRRYGREIYEKLILEGYISDYPNENKWFLKER